MPKDALWITTAEAVEISRLHVNSIRRLVQDGKILGRKFGTVWQINRRALNAYVKSGEKTGDARRGPHPRQLTKPE